LVIGERGRVDMRMELILRFGYGAIVPWMEKLATKPCAPLRGPTCGAATPVALVGRDLTHVAEFTVAAGERCRSY